MSAQGRSAQGRSLWRQWTTALVLAELVGFVPPAATGAALAAAGTADAVLVPALAAAGALEGAAIGVGQAWVLRRHAAPISSGAWVAATAAAAAFAWAVGMGGAAVMSAEVAPVPVLLAVLVPAWVAALLSMGVAQWLVMRHGLPGSGRWVWVTAGAWLAGVALPTTALSVSPSGWPAAAHAVVGVAAAVAMGLVVGVLTGRTMQRLLEGAASAAASGGYRDSQPTPSPSPSSR